MQIYVDLKINDLSSKEDSIIISRLENSCILGIDVLRRLGARIYLDVNWKMETPSRQKASEWDVHIVNEEHTAAETLLPEKSIIKSMTKEDLPKKL